MSAQQWRFSALDTLFFKESRPIESVGGSQLSSVFPPPARTLIGAIRTAIGEANSVDWGAYAKGNHPLEQLIGSADSLGPLRFCGPYLLMGEERLYPLPLIYLEAGDEQTRLIPGKDVVVCDLGRVQLPEKQKNLAGAKPREGAFVTKEGLSSFFAGMEINKKEIHAAANLFSQENRLGIARNNQTRVTGDGLLYQTQHIRPHHALDLQMAMSVRGLPAQGLPEKGMSRLGAEGRLAAWQRSAAVPLPTVQKPKAAQGIVLMLLTPALFQDGWLPDGFTKVNEDHRDVWIGEVAGIRLKIISSVIGKPIREGGWDMVNRAPRSLASYAPAGSCYFCELFDSNDVEKVQKALHGQQIGQETEYGRGELAVGFW